MNRRLRKKKHCGEFTEFGRKLVVIRNTTDDADAFHDAFILDAIEGTGCYCGGGLMDDGVDVIVELGRASTNPEGKFARITAWLEARPDVERWEAGPLVDLWHGDTTDSEA